MLGQRMQEGGQREMARAPSLYEGEFVAKSVILFQFAIIRSSAHVSMLFSLFSEFQQIFLSILGNVFKVVRA